MIKKGRTKTGKISKIRKTTILFALWQMGFFLQITDPSIYTKNEVHTQQSATLVCSVAGFPKSSSR